MCSSLTSAYTDGALAAPRLTLSHSGSAAFPFWHLAATSGMLGYVIQPTFNAIYNLYNTT